MERWCNSESLGRDMHSQLLMILHFIDWFSIKLSSVLLKRSLEISLHKLSTNFETSSLLHFLFPRFNVLKDAIFNISRAFPSIKSELSSLNTSYCNANIYQCIRILDQIWSISNKRRFGGGSQILPTWNW